MNCQTCNEQIVPYLEGLLDQPAAHEVQQHLAVCAACRADEQSFRALRDRLTAAGARETPGATDLNQVVMDQILIQQVLLTRRLIMKRRIRIFGVSGLAVALFIGLTWAALQRAPNIATAAEPIARGIEAASNLNTVHIKLRMRTLPADNFENLSLGSDFVDVELWKRFDPLQWRIDKPGRVAVMDGQQTILLLGAGKDRQGVKVNFAAPEAFDTGWLQRLASVDKVLSSELAAITALGYDVKVEHAIGADQASKDVVTVVVNTDDKVGNYLKNKFLETSDSRRVYTFDPKTHRLENLKFYCRDQGAEVLALEITKIEYDPDIDNSVFSLAIPENIVWFEEPQRLPDNEKYEQMTPTQAARAMFEACAKSDWDEASKFFNHKLTDGYKSALGGLTVIKIGEPFQAKPFPGWFVPYEIRRVDGQVDKFNLALRNDNPGKRYVVDGGL
jgi:outer membrane lipoprotein-sorting protein